MSADVPDEGDVCSRNPSENALAVWNCDGLARLRHQRAH